MLPSIAHAQTAPAPPNWTQHTQLGLDALQRRYLERTGLYTSTGWWNSANAITVLDDFMQVTGSRQYLPVLAHTFAQAQIVVPKTEQIGDLKEMTGAPGFLNTYYDDEGWWALAWIGAYDVSGEARYLGMAQSIFKDMAGGWDQTCGGGIWWSKDRTYKNAIANELFLTVATHLAVRAAPGADRAQYHDWAAKEWAWFRASGMLNQQGLVNDGLTIDAATGTCTNNQKTTWTYNQGVLIGALAEWSRISADPKPFLNQAHSVALAAVTRLTDAAGVLHDSCEPNCGGDGSQFKGIFVRNLAALQAIAPDPRWQQFVDTNAGSIWTKDQGPGTEFGVVWSGPLIAVDASAQSSALDTLVAEIAVHPK
ncbi:glycoside hydrolase family 76 protein [Acidipila sp. EB88]|uniref:glycoside hydrolase family 76 protein n=1 Tax=Acidipila sp. EB88 TaxID=2305226 RepID=UPI001F1FF900|nr:glycoside hydrolase family 76 protein [Acidipila sp. EB88]